MGQLVRNLIFVNLISWCIFQTSFAMVARADQMQFKRGKRIEVEGITPGIILESLPRYDFYQVNKLLLQRPRYMLHLHSIMEIAYYADYLYRAYEKEDMSMEGLSKHSYVSFIRRTMQQFFLLTRKTAARVQTFLKNILYKSPLSNNKRQSFIVPSFFIPNMGVATGRLHGAIHNNDTLVRMLNEIRAIRDVILDNLSDTAREQYVYRFGTKFVSERYVSIPGKKIKVVYGYSNVQLLSLITLSLLISGALGYWMAQF